MQRIDKEKERQVVELYSDPKQKLSIHQVADRLSIDPKTVWCVLIRNNQPRRSISEAKTEYPKTHFSGDRAEQAQMLGFDEDCGARYQWKQVRLATSTTHPAQIKRFDQIYGGYGHISRTPNYNRWTASYAWHLHIGLKRPSFDFLVEYKKNRAKFLA